MRTGPALVKASHAYAKECPRTTWGLFTTTVLAFAAGWAAVLLTPTTWWPVQLVASIYLGLVGVRLFIFYHDYCHGALFRGSRPGTLAMTAVGFYTLAVPSVWRETHDYHHKNNAKLTGSSIGSYPTVSLGLYRGMRPAQRRSLKVIRHPAVIALGLFTTFFLGMCLAPFRRDPKRHWAAPVAAVVWWLVFAALALGFGLWKASLVWFVPCFIHAGLGSYLFYAQHNFPDAELRDRRKWEYTHAALKASSYFTMPRWMHWFTGNIGYHHVHHLNHKIPFYRLPEAMDGMPELQSPGRTSWRPADIVACLRCAVWDPESGRMISFREADAHLEAKPVAAK